MNKYKKSYFKNIISTVLTVIICVSTMSGCSDNDIKSIHRNSQLDVNEDVTLVIAGSMSDFKAIDTVAVKFNELYPNCNVEYEYLQDYSETLPKRFVSDDDRVDMFITGNIQSDSEYISNALDFMDYTDTLDLSETFPGLVDNFKFTDDSQKEHLYAVPLGAEMRGLFVNKTLLSSLEIDTPKNRTELLSACEKLSEAGYIPFQTNPGSYGQQLIFPYIVHLITDSENHDEIYSMIADCDDEAAEIFRDPLEFLYSISADNYYNYKYVETEFNRFIDITAAGNARSFLNIVSTDDENYEKADDLGAVAFMTGSISLKTAIDKIKDDYHSKIEYEFILAPVSDDGGFAYMSPANGIAVNNNSENIDWCLEFINFLFTAENNAEFAKANNVIPNTPKALEYISKNFDIPESQISQPADIAFDYNFYNLIAPTIMAVSKSNNQKYMKDNGDGSYSMYDFEHYMDELKSAFAEQRKGDVLEQ